MTTFDARTARFVRASALLAALLAAGFVAGIGVRDALAHADHGMPARVQQGTCDALGPVAFELTGVGASEDQDGNAIPAPQNLGAPSAGEVLASITTVPATFEAIVSAPGGHAIVVSPSDDAMDVTVACGEVGGIVVGEDLVVALAAEGEEGMSGIALLRAEEEQTVVSLFLTPAAPDEHEATPTP